MNAFRRHLLLLGGALGVISLAAYVASLGDLLIFPALTMAAAILLLAGGILPDPTAGKRSPGAASVLSLFRGGTIFFGILSVISAFYLLSFTCGYLAPSNAAWSTCDANFLAGEIVLVFAFSLFLVFLSLLREVRSGRTRTEDETAL